MTKEDSSADQQPVYTANFTRLLDKRTFYSADELETWAQSARDAFAWLESSPKGTPANDLIITHTLTAYDRFLAAAKSLSTEIRKSDQQAIDAARGSLDSIVAKYFRKRILLPPEDARVPFLKQLAEKDPSTALFALGYFTSSLGQMTDGSMLKGAFRAMMFDLGISNDSEATRIALDSLLTEFRTHNADISRDLADCRQELTEIKGEREQTRTQDASLFQAAQAEREKQFRLAMEQSQERLAAFEKAYSEELATHSAVTYWGKKALVHRVLAAGSALATAAISVLYLLYLAPTVFEKLLGMLSKDEAPQWRIGIAIAVGLLGIWMLRILVRIFLSQVHLAADASHRRVTILSYLALLKDPTAPVSPQDRSLVLGTVFRPISDGIIRDDAMPPSPWELITRPPKG